MNYNFTDRVRKVLAMAREEAIRLQHDYVGTEHILLGLIREGEGVAAAVLTNLSVDLEQVQERIEESVRRGKATIALGELPYTSRAKKVLEFAMAEARELNHSYVGTEHLLLGLLREEKGIAAEVLNQLGVTLEEARRQTLKLLGSEPERGAGGVGGATARGSVGHAQGREEVQDARTRPLLPRPDRARAAERARPDHRPRRGDRAGDGDPVAAQEEQPGADRRARRGQDGDRRGAGAAHRERRVPGQRCATTACSRWTWPR